MTTYFISLRKRLPQREIRLEFAIPAACRLEAKQIAAKEIAKLNARSNGYEFQGEN